MLCAVYNANFVSNLEVIYMYLYVGIVYAKPQFYSFHCILKERQNWSSTDTHGFSVEVE